MAFYTLEEALKKTKDPLQAIVIKNYLMKNIFSAIPTFEFDSSDKLSYEWFIKNGVGGAGTREINGAFHQGTGSRSDIAIVTLGVYNEVRHIDRLMQDYYGDLLTSGLFDSELDDVNTSVAYKQVYDMINASKANGDKFDGLVPLAIATGKNYTIGDGGVAAQLTSDNIYDEFARMQDETLGEDINGAYIMSKKAFTKVNKLLKLAGFEVTVATDNFGRPYARFRDSLIIAAGAYTVDPQGGTPLRIDLMPTSTFAGTAGTERIVFAKFGKSHVHGLQGVKGPKLYTNINNLQPETHPTIDLEDTMAIVDKSAGAIAVLEGIIL